MYIGHSTEKKKKKAFDVISLRRCVIFELF